MTTFTLRQTPASAQGFTEPLEEVSESIPLDMILIQGGTFIIGSPENETGRTNSEGPLHEVTVPTFFMGRYPVTQAHWRIVTAMEQVKIPLKADPSNFKGDNRPVEQVNWYEAVEFCDRLSRHSGRPYRLPSEAEWEYACRAGATTPFAFGKTLTTEIANYKGTETYNDGPKGEHRRETTSVDYFGVANAWGLCDMHGNVYEWCLDHYSANYEKTPVDGSAWVTDNDNERRRRRGGSWFNFPGYCRSAFRNDSGPDDRDFFIGFRVVCSAPRTLQAESH